VTSLPLSTKKLFDQIQEAEHAGNTVTQVVKWSHLAKTRTWRFTRDCSRGITPLQSPVSPKRNRMTLYVEGQRPLLSDIINHLHRGVELVALTGAEAGSEQTDALRGGFSVLPRGQLWGQAPLWKMWWSAPAYRNLTNQNISDNQ